jgi:AbrB family looped-hinge helix DNA binding protein
MKATIAERGQVTIPKVLRRKLGIKPGMQLEFHEENGRLIAEKVSGKDQVERVYGCLKLGKGTDALLRELRGAA